LLNSWHLLVEKSPSVRMLEYSYDKPRGRSEIRGRRRIFSPAVSLFLLFPALPFCLAGIV
jgi:hypothetical protein